MSEFIELSDLYHELNKHFSNGFDGDEFWNSTHVLNAIEHTPTVEVIEVSQIERAAELLKADADGFKEHIQRDIDAGKEPDQAMVMMMHTAVVSYSALTCLVERYRRKEEE